MIYWYQNLYMDETVEKNPKRCKKRVEKRRPWKKSYVVLTLAQNDKNLFEIMQTRQLFFHRYRHVDMYVVAVSYTHLDVYKRQTINIRVKERSSVIMGNGFNFTFI